MSKLSTIATRLTAQRMPLSGRADSAVLAALTEYGPLSQADLGRRLGLDRNDVNGIVNRLQSGSYIDREQDSADRRRNIVRITNDGEAYLEDLLSLAEEVQTDLLAPLTRTQRAQLNALLTKLLRGHGPQPA